MIYLLEPACLILHVLFTFVTFFNLHFAFRLEKL